MNRRLFLLGTGGLLAGSWGALQAQPEAEVPIPQPPVNPAVPPQRRPLTDKTLIDDTDVGRARVDESEASPSDTPPPAVQPDSPSLEPGAAPHADVPPSL